MGLKSIIKYSSKIRQFAKLKKILIYTVNTHNLNSVIRALKQITKARNFFIHSLYDLCLKKESIELDAIVEAKLAIEMIVVQFRQSVELLPRDNNLVNIQIKLIKLYKLSYTILSYNKDQKVVIYPD